MRINIKKRSRRLETISQGDILIFPDRKEEVREVDVKACTLYTRREVENKDEDSIINPKDFPFKTEFVAYKTTEYNSTKIYPNAIGNVYNYIKRRKAI